MLKVLCSDLIPSSGEIVQILPTIRKAVQNLLDSSPRVSANNGGTCYACYFTSFQKTYISDELINGRLLGISGRWIIISSLPVTRVLSERFFILITDSSVVAILTPI